jgi:hypothetical protein
LCELREDPAFPTPDTLLFGQYLPQVTDLHPQFLDVLGLLPTRDIHTRPRRNGVLV